MIQFKFSPRPQIFNVAVEVINFQDKKNCVCFFVVFFVYFLHIYFDCCSVYFFMYWWIQTNLKRRQKWVCKNCKFDKEINEVLSHELYNCDFKNIFALSKVTEISSITKFTRFLFPHFRVTRAEIIRNVYLPLSAVRCFYCVHLSQSLLASKNYIIPSLLHKRIGKFLVVI